MQAAAWEPQQPAYAQSRDRGAATPAYAQSQDRGFAMPSEPRVTGRHRVVQAAGEQMEEIPPGEIQYEPMAQEGVYSNDNSSGPAIYGAGGTCADCDQGDQCGSCNGPRYDAFGYECFDGCLHLGWLRNFSFFAGLHGFKGPVDRGQNGNFGTQEGLNFSGPLGDPWGTGYQLGLNVVQSNFSGGPNVRGNDRTIALADRHQYFATAALFHRAVCGGLQWGVAFDYLQDEYYETTSLKQMRSETGLVLDDHYEIGYFGMYGVGTDRTIDGKLDPTDMFCVYARRYFDNGGDGRIWGGVTGYGDGVLGADLWVPLGKGFALENGVNFVIPKQGHGDVGQQRESWGLMMQLVWYPGKSALQQQKNPYRPMFHVADNSLFMVDRLAQ